MVKIYKNSKEITITGHAEFDEFGKDIVCAAVSSIVMTSINACLKMKKDSIQYKASDGTIRIIFKEKNEVINILLDNMMDMLKELETDYKKNIAIINEEV